ncbi:uncharacterized protein LOC118435205 [Folsomia candida]|uniref:uncharacterized protein LOC118435205 n=1 Tax=Folsomia candida TaxID=158441 RepID=UPI001604A552|nr:uncharacterized protein LOC118435205 [Folsomia candida]
MATIMSHPLQVKQEVGEYTRPTGSAIALFKSEVETDLLTSCQFQGAGLTSPGIADPSGQPLTASEDICIQCVIVTRSDGTSRFIKPGGGRIILRVQCEPHGKVSFKHTRGDRTINYEIYDVENMIIHHLNMDVTEAPFALILNVGRNSRDKRHYIVHFRTQHETLRAYQLISPLVNEGQF